MYNRADSVKALQYASRKMRENIMENKITDLVGKKVKCIKGLRGVTQNRVYEVIKISKDYQNFLVIVGDNGSEISWNSKHFEEHFEIMDEPQFKQGDKVLFTDDLVNWEEGIFLVKHDESYIVESDEMLLYAIEIKPYEEEIKVGDWVKRNNEIIRIEKGNRLDNNWTKITNQQLIELLNKEL